MSDLEELLLSARLVTGAVQGKTPSLKLLLQQTASLCVSKDLLEKMIAGGVFDAIGKLLRDMDEFQPASMFSDDISHPLAALVLLAQSSKRFQCADLMTELLSYCPADSEVFKEYETVMQITMNAAALERNFDSLNGTWNADVYARLLRSALSRTTKSSLMASQGILLKLFSTLLDLKGEIPQQLLVVLCHEFFAIVPTLLIAFPEFEQGLVQFLHVLEQPIHDARANPPPFWTGIIHDIGDAAAWSLEPTQLQRSQSFSRTPPKQRLFSGMVGSTMKAGIELVSRAAMKVSGIGEAKSEAPEKCFSPCVVRFLADCLKSPNKLLSEAAAGCLASTVEANKAAAKAIDFVESAQILQLGTDVAKCLYLRTLEMAYADCGRKPQEELPRVVTALFRMPTPQMWIEGLRCCRAVAINDPTNELLFAVMCEVLRVDGDPLTEEVFTEAAELVSVLRLMDDRLDELQGLWIKLLGRNMTGSATAAKVIAQNCDASAGNRNGRKADVLDQLRAFDRRGCVKVLEHLFEMVKEKDSQQMLSYEEVLKDVIQFIVKSEDKALSNSVAALMCRFGIKFSSSFSSEFRVMAQSASDDWWLETFSHMIALLENHPSSIQFVCEVVAGCPKTQLRTLLNQLRPFLLRTSNFTSPSLLGVAQEIGYNEILPDLGLSPEQYVSLACSLDSPAAWCQVLRSPEPHHVQFATDGGLLVDGANTNGKLTIGVWFRFHCTASESSVSLLEVGGNRLLIDESALHLERGDLSYDIVSPAIPELSPERWLVLVVSQNTAQTVFYLNGRVAGTTDAALIPNGDFSLLIGSGKGFNQGVLIDINSVRIWSEPLSVGEVAFATFGRLALPSSERISEVDCNMLRAGVQIDRNLPRPQVKAVFSSRMTQGVEVVNQVKTSSVGFTARMNNPVFLPFPFQIDLPGLFISCRGMEELLRWLDDESFPLNQTLKIAYYALNSRAAVLWQVSFIQRLCLTLKGRCREISVQDVDQIFGMVASNEQWDDPIVTSSTGFATLFGDFSLWGSCIHAVVDKATQLVLKCISGKYSKRNTNFLRGSGFTDVLLHSLYRGIQSRLAMQRGFEILKNCYVLLGNQVQHLISSANIVSQALQEVTREGTSTLHVKSRLSVALSMNETTTLIANTLLMLLEMGGISLTNFSTAFTTEWFVAVFCYAGHSVVAALALNLLIRIMLSPHGSTLRSGVARNITRIVSALNNHVRQPLLLLQLLAGVVGVALNIVKPQQSIEAQVTAAVNADGIGQTSISPLFLSTLVAHVRALALSHGWCEPDISVDTFCRYRPLPKWKKLLSVLRLRTAFTPFGRKTERWAVVRICLEHLKTIVGKPEWFGALVASPTSLQALDRLINWCPYRCLPTLSLDSSQGNAVEPTSPGSPHDFDFGVSVQPPVEVVGAAMGSSAPLSGSFILSTQRDEDVDADSGEADEGKDFDDLRSQLSVTISASSEEEVSEVSDLADDIYGFTKEFFRIAVKSLNRNAYASLLMGIDFLAGKESRQATKSIRVSHSGLTAALQSTFGEQITAAIEVFCGHVVNSYIAKQVDFKTCASILLHIFEELEETGPPPIVASEITRLCFTRLLDPKPFVEDISELKKALEPAFVGQAALATCGVYLIMKTGSQLYSQNPKSTGLDGLFHCMKILCRAAGPQAVKSALRSKGLIRSTDHATPFLEAMHSGTNAFWSWATGDPQILNTMRMKCASQIQTFTANQAIEIKRLQESARSLAETSPVRQPNPNTTDTTGVLCDYFPPRSTVLKELSLSEAQLSWLPIRCSTGPGRVGGVHYLDRYNNIVSVETEFSSIGDNLTHSDIAAMTSDDNITPLGAIVPGCVCAFPPNREPFSALPANVKRMSDSAVSFLRRLLRPNESIKAIENGFLVRGLSIVPALVLLTSTSLRLISNIELLPDGNILASQLEHAPASRGTSTFSAMNLVSGWIAPLGTLAARMTQRRLPETPLTRTDLKRVQEAHTKTLRRLHATSYADDKTHLVFEYPVLNIKEARPAVFQHHPAAIEVLLDMAQGVYFALVDEAMNFSKETRGKFLEVMKEMGVNVHDGFDKLTESKRQKWQQHQISTFDYLQYLNEAAGRRQADFSQYPVMPWILRGDISDDLLNLENPASFRNLRRPMGAQTEESIKKALERFQTATEMERESPNDQAFSDVCHHPTHYSTAAGVLYFFLRVQPHNSHIRTLQGGKLDHADRMFHSVEASWKAAIEIDGKELIPELFHCHPLLTNQSGSPLGARQNGDSIDDVKLPRWAKSPMHFALCMRLALESDYVSKEIPNWIDLVFGSKQRGEDAMNAINVYHPSSYSELVFKALGKSAHACDEIVSRVENFGQTPKQLFTVEHPPREPLAKQSRVLGFSQNFAAVMAIDVNITRPVVASDDPCIVQLLPTSQGIIASPARCYVTGRLNDVAITWNATDITRRAVKDGSFLADQFYFSPPCGGRITTVLFGRFEALGIVGTTTGLLYVLARDSDGNILQKSALVGHRHPVAGVMLASRLGMLVSFTNSDEDPPIVWRTFRQRAGFISVLQKSNLSVVDVTVNDSSGHIAAVSAKELHLFFRSGELLGVGQSTVEATMTCVSAFNTLEWCGGLSLYLTGHADGSVSLWHCQLNVSGEPLCNLTLRTNIKIRSGAIPVTKIHVGVDSLVMTLGFKDGRVSAFTLPHAELEKLGIHRERTGNLSISGASA